MAEKCVYCGNRKGKRECPALGGLICSVCCGEHRATEINCPTDCRYFQRGEEFQQEKYADPYREAWMERNADLFEEENYELLNTIGMFERFIYYQYLEDMTLTDGQVISGLTELDKKLRPIELPTKSFELTQSAYESIAPLIDQGKITRDVIRDALERFLNLAEDFSDGSRKLVEGLVGRTDADYDLPDIEEIDKQEKPESLITTPDQLNS